jgi:hypothetical protein
MPMKRARPALTIWERGKSWGGKWGGGLMRMLSIGRHVISSIGSSSGGDGGGGIACHEHDLLQRWQRLEHNLIHASGAEFNVMHLRRRVGSHVTRHTSHVTRHTSHVTRHTSHVTRHTSHVSTWMISTYSNFSRAKLSLTDDSTRSLLKSNIFSTFLSYRPTFVPMK